MYDFTTELIKNLSNNVSIEEIFRVELEKAFNQLLETELDCFLGYEKYSKDGYNTGDSRNGYYKRTFQTKYGELNLSIPKQTRIIRTCRKGYLFGIFRQICSCSMFNTTAPIFAKICSKNHPLRCCAILSRADFRGR